MIMTNLVFFTMEMKYILVKNISFQVGEFGAYETELVITIFILVGGILLGPEVMEMTMAGLLGISNETIGAIQVKHIGGAVFLPLIALFLVENLGECLKMQFWDSMRIFTPMIIVII